LVVGYLGIAFGHPALHPHSTAEGVHDAAKLSQQPISGILHDPPTMLSDLGLDERAQMVLEPSVRPLFVHARQQTVAGDIGCQNRGKSAFDAALSRSGHGATLWAGIVHRAAAEWMARRADAGSWRAGYTNRAMRWGVM